MADCTGVTINGSASYGNDPVPLFEAGKSNISCVLEIEALGQIQVSQAVMDGTINEGMSATFGGVTLESPILKYQISASSGQAYFVSTLTAVGRKS